MLLYLAPTDRDEFLDVPPGFHVVICARGFAVDVHYSEPGRYRVAPEWDAMPAGFEFPLIIQAVPCPLAHMMEQWDGETVERYVQKCCEEVPTMGTA